MDNFDLVSSLHALPETDPVEVDGIQFGGDCRTCQAACFIGLLTVVQTICVIGFSCA